jgi:hypothetical protein
VLQRCKSNREIRIDLLRQVCSFRLVAGRATTKVRYRFHDRVKRAKEKAVAAMAQTFRRNPKLDTAKVITELDKGDVPGRQRHAGDGGAFPHGMDRADHAEERKTIVAKNPVRANTTPYGER